MNILAVDFGTKHIGLAWCDTAIGVILPFGQVKKDELAELIKKEKIDKVVIGLPIGLDGRENANTGRVREFAAELRKEIAAPVEFFDERFSSQAADRLAGDVSRDEKAAAIILEDYLKRGKN